MSIGDSRIQPCLWSSVKISELSMVQFVCQRFGGLEFGINEFNMKLKVTRMLCMISTANRISMNAFTISLMSVFLLSFWNWNRDEYLISLRCNETKMKIPKLMNVNGSVKKVIVALNTELAIILVPISVDTYQPVSRLI